MNTEGRGQRRAAIGPVHHIHGTVEQPVLHGEVVVDGLVLVVVHEEVESVAVHVRGRVGGVAVTDNRVLSHRSTSHQQKSKSQEQHVLFHRLHRFFSY